MKRALSAAFVLLALAGAAHAFGIGMGNRFGRMGSFGSGTVTPPPPSSCANGNLLLVYSDPCQLMSQMVGN